MKQIWFTRPWPKLDWPIFTTLRRDKGTNYYQPHEDYEVMIGDRKKPEQGQKKGNRRVIAIVPYRVHDIDEDFARIDAHCSKKMFLGFLNGVHGKDYADLPYLLIFFCRIAPKLMKLDKLLE